MGCVSYQYIASQFQIYPSIMFCDNGQNSFRHFSFTVSTCWAFSIEGVKGTLQVEGRGSLCCFQLLTWVWLENIWWCTNPATEPECVIPDYLYSSILGWWWLSCCYFNLDTMNSRAVPWSCALPMFVFHGLSTTQSSWQESTYSRPPATPTPSVPVHDGILGHWL